jgi:hypothetical protein
MTGADAEEPVKAQQAQPPAGGARRCSFRRGFFQRNPLVLVVAAAFSFLALLGLQSVMVHGAITVLPQGRLLRIANDDYVHLSYRLANLKKHPPAGPTVYLFGGSGAMESFVSESSLAAVIERHSGGPVNVVSLAAHQQSLAQTLALIDNLPPGPAVLAVGLAPSRFTTAPADDEQLLTGRPLLLRSPRLEQLAARLFAPGAPRKRGLGGVVDRAGSFLRARAGVLPGMLDYAGSYLRARAENGPFWGTEIDYSGHYYPPGATGALPLAKRLEIRAVLSRDKRLYAEYGDYDLVVLDEILKLAAERGDTVVLWDQPLNSSAAGPTWGGVSTSYRRRVTALARSEGVAYLDVAGHLALRDADFADLYHLLDHGRLQWQRELGREIAPAVQALAAGPEQLGPSPAASPSP